MYPASYMLLFSGKRFSYEVQPYIQIHLIYLYNVLNKSSF